MSKQQTALHQKSLFVQYRRIPERVWGIDLPHILVKQYRTASAFHLPDRGIVDWFWGWRILLSHTLSCFLLVLHRFCFHSFRKMNPLPPHSSVLSLSQFSRKDKGFFHPLWKVSHSLLLLFPLPLICTAFRRVPAHSNAHAFSPRAHSKPGL